MVLKKLKKAGAWLLAFSLVLGTVQFSGVKAEEGDSQNLALSAAATASNEEDGHPVTMINDGIDTEDSAANNRWSHNRSSSAWVKLAWEETQMIKSFSIHWERRNAAKYQIEISSNGKIWKKATVELTYPTSKTVEISLSEAVEAKYLRLNISDISEHVESDGNLSWKAVSIYEFKVYAGDIPEPNADAQKINDADYQYSSAFEEELDNILKDAVSVPMPEEAKEADKVSFYADYEQVVNEEGNIYTPLEDKLITGYYEITKDGTTTKTEEYSMMIPGQYTEDQSNNARPSVIPELQEWYGRTGDFMISASSRIVIGDDELSDVAAVFQEDYKDITGMDIEIVRGTESDAKPGDFYMSLTEENKFLGKEGYTIDINNMAVIEAEQTTGAYWSTRTILQILKQTNGTIPRGIVRDYPKYENRGFSLDVGRKPFSMDTLYQFMKNMSWYKLNNFQVHLNDNLIFTQDYNVTGDAAANQQNAIDNLYAGYRLQSDVKNTDESSEKYGATATSEDMFYTKDEFRTFIQESRAVGVDIVPELDMPAHAVALTRAFPQYMRMELGSGKHTYLIDHLNLSDETYDEVLEWVKDIWNDYLLGDDPVFDKDTTLHIGTDEYDGNNSAFRRFSNDLITFVQDEAKRKVRIWGSLTTKSGSEQVRSEGVQMNVWNSGWANPRQMYNEGYELINTLDSPLYMVPSGSGGRGGYGDRLDVSGLYNGWQVNNLDGYTVPAGDDQMLGACYAVWHDNIDTRGNGMSEYDSFDRFFESLPAFSAKVWGEAYEGYADFLDTFQRTGTAPNTNMYKELDYKTNTAADWEFENTDVKKDSSVNGFDLTKLENATQVSGEGNGTKALKLAGGASYAETPLDQVGENAVITMKVKMDENATIDTDHEQILCESKESFGNIGTYAIKAAITKGGNTYVGFSREGYDYVFDYELPRNEWVTLEFRSGQDRVALYIDGELVDDDPDFYYDNNPEMQLKGTANVQTYVATMMVPIGRIGSKEDSFQGEIEFVKVTGAKASSGNDTISKADLQEALNSYKDYSSNDYVDMSWLEFDKVRNDTLAIINYTGTLEADDYAYAYEQLQKAAQALKEKPDDYKVIEDLNTAKDQVLNSSNYSGGALATMQTVLDSISEVLAKPDATTEELSEASQTLNNIIKVDNARTQLKNEIAEAQKKLANTTGYTTASVNAFKSVVEKAQTTLNKLDSADADTYLAGLEASLKELSNAVSAIKGQTLVKDTGLKDNDPFEKDGMKYQVVSASALTAKLVKGTDTAKPTIDTVSYDGKTYKIVEIGAAAFSGCKKKLKKVTIGPNVAVIGKNAFKGCKKLANVVIKNNSKLTKVGGGAFKKTSSKIKVKLPKNLKKNKKLKKQLKKAGIKKGL